MALHPPTPEELEGLHVVGRDLSTRLVNEKLQETHGCGDAHKSAERNAQSSAATRRQAGTDGTRIARSASAIETMTVANFFGSLRIGA